jgi:hypothetical protein
MVQEWLIHPVVQGAIIPFLAALVVGLLAAPLRLAGLCAVAGFAAAVYVAVGFQFSPMTTVRKLVLLGLLAPVIGVIADLAFRKGWTSVLALAGACGAASIWVFLAILRQWDLAPAVIAAGATAAYVAWQVGTLLVLREDPVRAGAAGFALGLGTGAAAVISASATLGVYAMAFGTASSAFLLMQMIAGKRIFAGTAFALTVGLLAGLVGVAAVLLAKLPWHALLVMALVPLAARAPVPARWPVWGQIVAISALASVVAAGSCVLAWQATGAE